MVLPTGASKEWLFHWTRRVARSINGKQRRTKGWFFVGNYMYYVKADGSIATNTTIDGYKIGADGAVTWIHARASSIALLRTSSRVSP